MVDSGARLEGGSSDLRDGAPPDRPVTGCIGCHGSAASPAPPLSLAGKSATSERGVGAHTSHLKSSTWRADLPCASCHKVPAKLLDPGHIDTAAPAEVIFSKLASADGAKPSWTGSACSGSYCHGATLSGGSNTSPLWTKVDGSQAACGSCHGMPPTKQHTPNKQCSMCHAKVVDSTNKIIDAALHINGKVEVVSLAGCDGCHGSATNAAPPKSLSGKTAKTVREVGAHQEHLKSSTWRAKLPCSSCHLVPKKFGDQGHVDSATPAEVVFSTLAKTDSTTPGWDGTSCSGTYCHGATLSGGSATAPTWTKVDGSQAKCGSCHGLPPDKGHPPNKQCSMCHAKVVDSNNKIIDAALHINGKVEVVGLSKCNACHGSTVNAAPPVSLSGKTAKTVRQVGAHQEHLKSSTWRAKLPCQSCHLVPKVFGDKDHADTAAPAEVTFSALASGDGAKPKWDGIGCAGTYCHGATLSGGSATAPTWTKVDGSQAACGACHGLPPAQGHSPSKLCSMCHGSVVDSNNKIVAPALHINGKVEVANLAACNGCHGNASNAAPPKSVTGKTANTAREVGAHQAHLKSSSWRAKLPCQSCHLVPKKFGDKGHVDTSQPAEVAFSALARTGGVKPTWDGASCDKTYCHGATLTGGKLTRPAWTKVDGTQAACGTCHGLPPQNHLGNKDCHLCHDKVIDASRKFIAPALHVDGQVSATGGCTICHAKVQGSRRQIVGSAGDFAAASHHVTGTIKDADCVVCHDVTAHRKGVVRLRDVDGGATVYAYSASNPAAVEGHCLSCHDSDGANGDTTPFSSGVTVRDIKGAGSARWSTSAHRSLGYFKNGNKPLTCLGNGTTSGCHVNGHGSDSGQLLNMPASATMEQLCYKCHTQGGVKNYALSNRKGHNSADDIQQAFGKTRRHKLNSKFTINGKSYTLQCTTCHNPHLVSGKYWDAATNKTPVTRPNFSDPAKNPRAVGATLWGDGAGEKMKDYAGSGTYRAPNNDLFTGDQLPDYVTFCLDCHGKQIGKGAINWSRMHGKAAAGPPAGGYGPNWFGFGKGAGWNGDACIGDQYTCWPVTQRGKGFLMWTRKPYDQAVRIANGNFVLSCRLCRARHKPHYAACSIMPRGPKKILVSSTISE